jgi:hypothetical protein
VIEQGGVVKMAFDAIDGTIDSIITRKKLKTSKLWICLGMVGVSLRREGRRDARSCFGFRSPLIGGTDRHRDIA